ncbi:MAG: NAD(+)/NADH kinase [Amoebophilaceae bacterium]|nr:NAD(+)/NADH kinase [Amoebophilaceae bacterium]
MLIAIHARKICPTGIQLLAQLQDLAYGFQKKLLLSEELAALLASASPIYGTFKLAQLHLLKPALMVSLGGDGTFLETAHYIHNLEIPLLGINTGSLGFLAGLTAAKACLALTNFLQGNYRLESRTLLHLKGNKGAPSFALNEIALLKRDAATLLTIDAYINQQLITTYWADGLIIATPTGSTAYSMSCFGPIMLPSTRSFVITPVNPHNLAVRPLVVPQTAKLHFFVRGRNRDMIISADGRATVTATGQQLSIKKASFTLKMVQFGDLTIFDALREKFYWGIDARNK